MTRLLSGVSDCLARNDGGKEREGTNKRRRCWRWKYCVLSAYNQLNCHTALPSFAVGSCSDRMGSRFQRIRVEALEHNEAHRVMHLFHLEVQLIFMRRGFYSHFKLDLSFRIRLLPLFIGTNKIRRCCYGRKMIWTLFIQSTHTVSLLSQALIE